MSEIKTVQIDKIGPVVFHRSARAGRIIITVSPGKGVRVAVPRKASFDDALEFVKLKNNWVRKHLEKIRRNNTRHREYADTLANIDQKKAGKALSDRLKRLAEKHGFEYQRLTVRKQRTRWGSCSHKNAISLNLKLVILPEELRDYVMLHELVHTRIHNHSQKFWDELNRYVGNGKALAARLRDYDLRQIG